MKKSIILLAMFALIFASCKKTEILEVEEVLNGKLCNEKNVILAPPSNYKVHLCALSYDENGNPIMGYMCHGVEGHCTREILKCTSFGSSKSVTTNLGDILAHELIIVDSEMIKNNIDLFQPLIDEGIILLNK